MQGKGQACLFVRGEGVRAAWLAGVQVFARNPAWGLKMYRRLRAATSFFLCRGELAFPPCAPFLMAALI